MTQLIITCIKNKESYHFWMLITVNFYVLQKSYAPTGVNTIKWFLKWFAVNSSEWRTYKVYISKVYSAFLLKKNVKNTSFELAIKFRQANISSFRPRKLIFCFSIWFHKFFESIRKTVLLEMIIWLYLLLFMILVSPWLIKTGYVRHVT